MSIDQSNTENVEQLPAIEVVGTEENFDRYGSPIERRNDAIIRYYFYPTWRSQLSLLAGFLITGFLCASLSSNFSWLVIKGPLLTLGDTKYILHLPLLSLIPAFFLGKLLMRMYDSRYMVDARGVEAQVGLVSLKLRQPRLRFEDIRGVEPEQTIMQRILGIGDVAIGSAMTDGVEILMLGVANPRAVQLFISSEMEKRLKSITQGGNRAAGAYVSAVRGD